MISVVMLLIFPIGVAFFIYEIRERKHYDYLFSSFFDEVRANDGYSDKEKIDHVRNMLEHNDYHIVSISKSELLAEKKILSVGILFMSMGFFYIGALLYMLYYFKIQKPHRLKFTV